MGRFISKDYLEKHLTHEFASIFAHIHDEVFGNCAAVNFYPTLDQLIPSQEVKLDSLDQSAIFDDASTTDIDLPITDNFV